MIPCAILALAAGLRLYQLGSVSLWTDELFTKYYVRTGQAFLWGEGLRLEPTPPLYYSLTGLWTALAGDGAFALRVPSFFGSLLSVGITYALGRELFSRRRAAILAAVLLALSPTSIFYAQEARSYALQGAALALALLGFARCLRHGVTYAALSLYMCGALLAIYLHMTSILAVVAINVAALASTAGQTRLLDRRGFVRWCAGNAVVALACLPLVPLALSPMVTNASSWMGPMDRWVIEGVWGVTLMGPAMTAQALFWGEIAVPALAALLLLPPWRPGRLALTVVALVPLLFLALMLGISLKRPLLLTRTVSWLWVPLALVLGDVLARRFWGLAAGAVLLACAGAGLHVREAVRLKEDWQGFLPRLGNLAPSALVVLGPVTPPTALLEYRPAVIPVRLAGTSPPTPETTLIPAMTGTQTVGWEIMEAAIAKDQPVWLILRRPEYPHFAGRLAALPPPRETVWDGPPANPAVRALRW